MKQWIFFTRLIFITLLSGSLLSCSLDVGEYDDFPEVDLPSNKMNTEIQIEELPQFGNSHLNNKFLGVHVINMSTEAIVFAVDSFVYLFTKNGEDWISVTNNMHYSGESRKLYPAQLAPPGMAIDIVPYIPEMVEEQTIRVIVIGHYESNIDQLVGAYLDVTIYP